jgi:hypothetical protein
MLEKVPPMPVAVWLAMSSPGVPLRFSNDEKAMPLTSPELAPSMIQVPAKGPVRVLEKMLPSICPIRLNVPPMDS